MGTNIVNEGYHSLQTLKTGSHQRIWVNIWDSDNIPKINAFFWILGHGKTLTADNLRKRGLEGLLRCILCKEFEESLEHLFLECKFSREVWHQAYKELQFELTLPTNWDDRFARWKDYYQGHSSTNQILQGLEKLFLDIYAGRSGQL